MTGDGEQEDRGRMMEDRPKYKFQRLEEYQLALEYVNAVYDLSRRLPEG